MHKNLISKLSEEQKLENLKYISTGKEDSDKEHLQHLKRPVSHQSNLLNRIQLFSW